MIDVDAATVLLQWAAGGLFFLWVTTRRREVGIGYGWTMRITYVAIATIGVVVGILGGFAPVRDVFGIAMIGAASVALAVSVIRRKAGVAGQREVVERREARVAEMTGIDRDQQRFDKEAEEFPPILDLIAPALGLISIVGGAVHAGGSLWLGIARVVVGAAFLGAVSDAMMLGHWYLVQPGLARGPLLELVRWTGIIWPFELLVLLLPTGMISVITGDIDDGYGGMLGWFWMASTAATIILIFVTRAALKERQYAAVMAATGLLYLAILMAFGQDLVARILLDA